VECIVRDSYPPRGPKKEYLRTLQKKIEELESQLEKQGTSPAPICQTVDNDSSTDNNENHTTTPKTTDILQWPATPVEFLFPTVKPWGCFNGSYTSSPLQLPPVDSVPELVQIPMDSGLLISPMMHNDL
jgi:hypothetical protein